jgi:hypothetical protein
MIRDCRIDPERLAPVRECMETYGQDHLDPDGEWPWNVISKRAVAYSCGAIARAGAAVEHCHQPDELERCRRLAGEAARFMAGVDVGMGNEGSCEFSPFFVTANVDQNAPRRLTEAVVRGAFGGTISPSAQIVIEPLWEQGQWWSSVLHWYGDNDDPEAELRPWRELIRWFRSRDDLLAPSFVMIGDRPRRRGAEQPGSVFPRLALGLTQAGSLVGICGWTVHT